MWRWSSTSSRRPWSGSTCIMGLLAIISAGCGSGPSMPAGSPVTVPDPGCASGVGIGPANRPLTREEKDAAEARVKADPVIAQIRSSWRILSVGPSSARCADQHEQLVGASVRVSFAQPEDVAWDEDAVVCVRGQAQPTRLEDSWSGIRGAAALVPLPTGMIRWTPVPPDPPDTAGRLTQITKSTLGPRGGSCPRRRSTD